MTDSRDPQDAPAAGAPGELDVPVARIDRGAGRRARSSVVLTVGVLAAVIAVALLGTLADGSPEAPGTAAPAVADGRQQSGEAAPTAPPRPTTGPPPWVAGPARERAEAVPELATRSLAGAPRPIFHRRSWEDLERLAWDPAGTSLESLGTLRGALDGIGPREGHVAVQSPDGALVAVRGLASFGGTGGDVVRVVAADGRRLWSRDDARGFPVAPIWSSDARLLLLPHTESSWRLLEFDGPRPSERVLTPGEPAGGEIAGYRSPLGFSRDGRWLYATDVDFRRPGYRPAVRISTADGSVEPVDRFPVTGGEAPDAGGRLAYEVDPASGRRFVTPGLALATGPTDVRVYEADGSEAFVARLDTVVGTAWAGDGRLLALETDTYPEPSVVRLVAIGEDGTVGPPLLESGALSWASLAGVRDGHVLLAFSASGEREEVLVALVRLSDGAAAAISVAPQAAADLQFGGWDPATTASTTTR